MQYTYWDFFSIAQNSFWTQFWCLLVLLLCFLFHLYHIAKHFPLKTFFIRTNKKRVSQGEINWIGSVGPGDCAIFGQKLLNTQHGVGRCARKLPIIKCAYALKESSRNFHWSQCSLSLKHQLLYWWFLEHSPSGGSLYYKGAHSPEDNYGLGGTPFYKV